MDYAACHAVYLDGSILEDRSIAGVEQDFKSLSNEPEIQGNIETLLQTFNHVHVCTTGVACLDKVKELESIATSCTPTLIFVEVTLESNDKDSSEADSTEDSRVAASQDSDKPRQDSGASGDFSGLALIKHLQSDISRHNLSKLTVPIALVPTRQILAVKYSLSPMHGMQDHFGHRASSNSAHTESEHMMRCVQAGATDIVIGELTKARVAALAVHAHRARLEGTKEQPTFLEQRRMRKRSWVGVDEERPYAYLRESMVSTLMESICKPHSAIGAVSSASPYTIKPGRETVILKAITSWNFSAHSFSDDELLHAAFLMLQHALTMDELDKWRIPADELRRFLLASRSAYNQFVLYHNFRHVIDVLQAVWFFLLQIGTIPPHPAAEQDTTGSKHQSPIAALLTPFDAFVLLISAVGHDVGHPGVNNAFLIALKAPLAQLYNDNSVLEAFHCAAYSQILRRYWNSVFEDTSVRRLLIKSILATDMQMHFKYMADLGNLQEKLAHNKGTDGWSVQQLEEYKVLVCGLLIKCADISNVARPFEIAAKWADILQEEFSRQGEMERNVGIPTTLFGGPPEIGNLEKLGQSQIGFMNVFAYPLFESVADILPSMKFGIVEIKANQAVWKRKIEQAKTVSGTEISSERSEGFQSPRSISPDRVFAARSPETSHPEGLPASGSSPMLPVTSPMSTSTGTPELASSTNLPPPTSSGVGRAISTPDIQSEELDRKKSFGLPIIPTDSFHANGTPSNSTDMFDEAKMANMHANVSNRSIPSLLQLGSGSASANRTPSRSQENIPPSQVVTPSAPPPPPPQTYGGMYTHQRSEPGTPATPPVASANFSRPMSMRHSAHHSYARSSAPSNAPTFSSTVLPTSPTETQATSVATEPDEAVPGSVDLDRPSSGYSSALATSTASSSRSPGQASTIKTPPSGNGMDVSNRSTGVNGHGEGPNKLRKQRSRFKLDFWRRKKGEAITP